jgi:signal transduction histidine kinase
MRPVACQVRQLVDEAAADATALATAAGVDMVVEVPTTLPPVLADPDRIVQVLTNLVGNAVKFTPREGKVTLRVAEADDNEIAFAVCDSGRGIAAQDLPHVFERYWQARPGDKIGSGLGLAICKALVELAGGRIWVVSAPSRGTTVTFTLPAAPPPSDDGVVARA